MKTYHYVTALKAFADLDPKRVLLATPDGTISAGELYARASGLAGYLHAHGVEPGQSVGTMLCSNPGSP